MKRLGCLVFLSPSMSRGRRRGCYKALARYVACPLWDSQSVTSQEMEAPSNSSRGDQVRCPLRTTASSRLSIDLALLSLGSLAFFCCLAYWGSTSPSSKSSTDLFLLRFGLACNLRSMGRGGGEGRLARTCTLGASLKDCPLFLLAIRPFKPDLYFRSMPSSSISWLVSIQVTINLRECAAENRSRSASESDNSDGLVGTSPSSLKRKWSISASRDEWVESISSLGAWRTRWVGGWTGGKSLRAKNPSLETSIRANLEFPALIAWPTSWKIQDNGLYSKMRWATRNCPFSLTKISDLRR